MRRAVLVAPSDLRIEEAPVPEPGPGEILVKVEACGICTLEQRLYAGSLRLPLPLVPGHEAAGSIVKVGTGVVEDLAEGQKVALDLVYRCGECYYCRIGKSNLCLNRYKNPARMLGGFSDYLIVRPSQVFPVGGKVGFVEASFAEPLACCIHSLKRLKVAMTEDLLVVGAGVMGLLHVLAARCMGLRVTVSEPDPLRRAKAMEMGADFAVDPASVDLEAFARDLTGGTGFSSCVITSPAPGALEPAFRAMAKASRINIYTAYEDEHHVPLDLNTIHRNELLVTGTEGRLQEDFLQAVRLLSFGKVDVKPLVSGLTSFSTLDEGFRLALSGKAYRVVLVHGAA
ncbi:MAG: alcohol dehydrogenase catalytic domain-containing protein [Spirochaetaceae bacterium]|nr:alcohol dehydrogenase catalytic domain-containing protein [Spirochaetaceae bacterium]